MRQIDKIKAVRQALESADPDPLFLQPAADHKTVHGHPQYICPFCGHGSHGDGLQHIKNSPAKWYCFGACSRDYDLIDLYKQAYGETDTTKAAEGCADALGVYVPEIEQDKKDREQRRPLRAEDYPDETAAGAPSLSARQEAIVRASAQALRHRLERQRQQAGAGTGSPVQPEGDKSPRTETAGNTARGQEMNDSEDYNKACREYIEQCHARANETGYFAQRGISAELVSRFRLGYDPRFPLSAPIFPEAIAEGKTTPAAAYGVVGGTWQAVIIPLGDGSRFCARNIGIPSGVTDKAAKMNRYRFTKSRPLFNPDALAGDKPVFIVEGQFDALAIIAAGGQAVALGGGGTSDLIWRLKQSRPRWPLILAQDNDSAGQQEMNSLIKALGALPGMKWLTPSGLYGGYKDANEALIYDGAGLAKRIKEAEQAAIDKATEEERQEEAAYFARHEQGFNDLLEEQKDRTPRIKTGFWVLDAAIGGGLRRSCAYILAAIPSLGKSTLVLQIADRIAADYETNRRDVLFFALEMGTTELIAKSVSRLTAADAIERSNDYYRKKEKAFNDNQLLCNNWEYAKEHRLTRLHYDDMPPEKLTPEEYQARTEAMRDAARGAGAVSANAIGEGLKFFYLSEYQKERAGEAMRKYKADIFPHLFIKQGAYSISEIYAAIDEHIAMRRRQWEREGRSAGQPEPLAPVVFIDYLQILEKEEDERYTSDKDKLDQDSKALKRIAVKYKTPVICISSVNRAAYKQDGDMSAVKGSGDIEFNVDFLFILQFSALKWKNYNVNAEKRKDPRAVQLLILKSRGERASDTPVYFNYFPAWNYYAGTLTPPPAPPEEDNKKDKDRPGKGSTVTDD